MATRGPTNSSLAAAATYLNEHMWEASVLGRHNFKGAKITFHGEMTPRVYDPMSTLLFGACNCGALQLCEMQHAGVLVALDDWLRSCETTQGMRPARESPSSTSTHCEPSGYQLV
eukprot:COSAG02_NODE_7_length_64539_cov_120.393482_55_plen_115_part_00